MHIKNYTLYKIHTLIQDMYKAYPQITILKATAASLANKCKKYTHHCNYQMQLAHIPQENHWWSTRPPSWFFRPHRRPRGLL